MNGSISIIIRRPDGSSREIPLNCSRSGLHNSATPNGRGQVQQYHAVLSRVVDENGRPSGPWLDARIQAVHDSACKIFRRKVCTCDASKLLADLNAEIGEPDNCLPGYGPDDLFGTAEEREKMFPQREERSTGK